METEKKETKKFTISWALLWTIVVPTISAIFSLGIYVGTSKFDKEKIRCFLDKEKLQTELSFSKDSITVLKDSINHLCQCDTNVVYDVFDGHLHQGLDMGVATSGNQTGWVDVVNGEIRMNYPSGQSWGAMFITVGKPVPLSKRRGTDFSKYKTLEIELKGSEGSVVEIGLKDNTDEDSGLETKIALELKKDWVSHEISLNKFQTADLKRLNIVTEFVFAEKAQMVYVRKIRFK
jgi:hypothetical protein